MPRDLILASMGAAWPKDRVARVSILEASNLYAKSGDIAPGPLEVDMDGSRPLRVFVAPTTGELLAVMDHSCEAYALLYYMLHTYNFPGLAARPDLRGPILLAPLARGFGFSALGVLVGVRRLRATFPQEPSRQRSSPA